jgi:hypothetical protein
MRRGLRVLAGFNFFDINFGELTSASYASQVMKELRKLPRLVILVSLLLVGTVNTIRGQEPSSRRAAHTRLKIGIFGFGSLIADPGEELAKATASRMEAETPFAVEYGRTSKRTRGGAPTLVPVNSGGAHVKATIFVLKDSISQQEAKNILWRRETRQVGSGKAYKRPANPGPSSVLVAVCKNFMGLDRVLYTDFADSGKLEHPTATQLAELAVASARKHDVPEGMDGISYLTAAKKAGITTPLSGDYEKEILRITTTASLEEALAKARAASASK